MRGLANVNEQHVIEVIVAASSANTERRSDAQAVNHTYVHQRLMAAHSTTRINQLYDRHEDRATLTSSSRRSIGSSRYIVVPEPSTFVSLKAPQCSGVCLVEDYVHETTANHLDL
jgi:hypothetical protein